VTDLKDNRLSLQVVEEMEVCYIGKPRHHLEPEEEKKVLRGFTQEFNSTNAFSSRRAVHEELIFIPTAHISHNELPTKLRSFCPAAYRVQAFRYIQKERQLVSVSQSGDMIIQDPEIQRDYSNGDILRTEDDVLPEGLQNITRRKRGPRCLAMDNDGQLIHSNCMWVKLSCTKELGCPGTHVYYTCSNNLNSNGGRMRGCEYILLCATMNNHRCAVHSESTAVRCEQCCISDDCGSKMPKCSASTNGVAVDYTTRYLTMKVNLKKLGAREEYDAGGAHISLSYQGRECATSIIPTALPDPDGTTQTLVLDTQGFLATCWGFDVSQGEHEMKMKLKLPVNSPIAVSKVQVIDSRDHTRCWTAKWRSKSGNYNKQNNQWVSGVKFYFDDDCVQ